jgi:hypothetical protein
MDYLCSMLHRQEVPLILREQVRATLQGQQLPTRPLLLQAIRYQN